MGQGVPFDIIASFPLELLVQVVQYLDLTDIVRSQRVHFPLLNGQSTILTGDNLGIEALAHHFFV